MKKSIFCILSPNFHFFPKLFPSPCLEPPFLAASRWSVWCFNHLANLSFQYKWWSLQYITKEFPKHHLEHGVHNRFIVRKFRYLTVNGIWLLVIIGGIWLSKVSDWWLSKVSDYQRYLIISDYRGYLIITGIWLSEVSD